MARRPFSVHEAVGLERLAGDIEFVDIVTLAEGETQIMDQKPRFIDRRSDETELAAWGQRCLGSKLSGETDRQGRAKEASGLTIKVQEKGLPGVNDEAWIRPSTIPVERTGLKTTVCTVVFMDAGSRRKPRGGEDLGHRVSAVIIRIGHDSVGEWFG